jgi:hypothetical protein
MKSMGKKAVIVFLAGIFGVFIAGAAMAQHGQGQGQSGGSMQGSQGGHSMQGSQGSHSMPMMMNRPVQVANVDGMKVTLDVMDMSLHTSMQNMKGNPMHGVDHTQSHAIMLTVQDTASKEILSDAKVRYTLVTPSGEKETGTLAWSGDHFGGGFNPKVKGPYQIQFLIETGGMEREATFTYEAKT